MKNFGLIISSLFIIISSCQKEIKENQNLITTKSERTQSIVFSSSQSMNPSSQSSYIDETKPSVRTEKGKQVILIGGARLSDLSISPELTKTNGIESYILTAGSYSQAYSDYLKSQGIIIGYYVPENSVVVKVPKGITIGSLRGVQSATPYQPYMKISKSDGDVNLLNKVKVTLWNTNEVKPFREYCVSNNYSIKANTGKDFIIEGKNLRDLLFQEIVLKVEKYHNSAVFSVSGGNVAQVVWGTSFLSKAYSGRCAKVSVLDMGVDSGQSDLQGVLDNVYDDAMDGDTGEVISHGTHIAGIIAGCGNLSQGQILGVSPSVKIDFHALGNDLTGLVIPPSLSDIFQLSLLNGSYIANLSWGTYSDNSDGKYMSISRDIDSFVYQHPEMIVVVAAGNDGKSIASPATAKDVITVGALDGQSLADYSGRGTCSDGRVKPEVTVQGSGIDSLGLNNSYAVMSGTSQAAAVVSGIISKLYGIVQKQFGIKPTHSVIKSFLIANTLEDNPSDGLGYGRLYFGETLNQAHYSVSHFSSIGQLSDTNVDVVAGDDLTIVLSWTEPPACESSFSQLINNLDMSVTDPTGKVFDNNDSVNNLEKIIIHGTTSGTYRLKLLAKLTPMAIPDIALVIKSAKGFNIVSTNTQSAWLQGQQGQLVNTTSGNTGNTSGQNSTGINAGNSAGNGSATGYVNTETDNTGTSGSQGTADGSSSAITAAYSSSYPSIIPNLSGLSTSSNATLSNGNSIVYFRMNNGSINIRPLGVNDGQLVGLMFQGEGIQSGTALIPVTTNLNGVYRPISVSAISQSTNISANLMLSVDGSGITNTVPMTLLVDGAPPYLGRSYPTNGGVLTNTTAWIELKDKESGLD